MQIDPLQPIMFDNETNPGVGAGWWQVNPFAAANREFTEDDGRAHSGRSIRPKTLLALQASIVVVVAGFITIGWIAPLL
ncbi:MAG: hypothetical protein EON56_05130 [Alphaproteobacteria bacterium]|nr:MAG: hypothetical protein EON56_05130 [Alphaproteobacteria bacterium]